MPSLYKMCYILSLSIVVPQGVLALTITANTETRINISAPTAAIDIQQYLIQPASSQTFDFPWEKVGIPGVGDNHKKHGILVTSSEDIKVEVMCEYTYSHQGDIMLIYPMLDNDNEFVITVHKDGGNSKVSMMATQDDTHIKIFR